MNDQLKTSVQTMGWYDTLFGGDREPDAAFEFIRSIGIDTLDYNVDTLVPGKDIRGSTVDRSFFSQDIGKILEYFAPVKEAALRHGVTFGQAHAPFPMYVEGNPDLSGFLVEVVNKLFAVCEYIGCPAIVVHPYFEYGVPKSRIAEINLDMYRKLMPAAKKHGVKICLENLFTIKYDHVIDGTCSDAKEACWYIDTLNAEAGEDIFGYCFDVGHANITGKNIREEINTLGHRLTILHIHDNDGKADLHQCPYTQKYDWGRKFCTDWEGFIEGLRDINYRGTLNFEASSCLAGLPHELIPSMLCHIANIGEYFRNRILK